MNAEASAVQDVMDRCAAARFTGVLRVRARQGEGEIAFISGIVDSSRFGVSVGDEAMKRLVSATETKMDLVARLPNLSGNFKKGQPLEGELGAELRPIDLFNFCESQALTCTIELASKSLKGEATYKMGELETVRCDPGTDRAVAEMLEWTEGTYRFALPTIELPPDVQMHMGETPPPPAIAALLAEAGPSARPPQEPAKPKPVEQPRAEAVAKPAAREERPRVDNGRQISARPEPQPAARAQVSRAADRPAPERLPTPAPMAAAKRDAPPAHTSEPTARAASAEPAAAREIPRPRPSERPIPAPRATPSTPPADDSKRQAVLADLKRGTEQLRRRAEEVRRQSDRPPPEVQDFVRRVVQVEGTSEPVAPKEPAAAQQPDAEKRVPELAQWLSPDNAARRPESQAPPDTSTAIAEAANAAAQSPAQAPKAEAEPEPKAAPEPAREAPRAEAASEAQPARKAAAELATADETPMRKRAAAAELDEEAPVPKKSNTGIIVAVVIVVLAAIAYVLFHH